MSTLPCILQKNVKETFQNYVVQDSTSSRKEIIFMLTGKVIAINLKFLPSPDIRFPCLTAPGLRWGKCQICIWLTLKVTDSLNWGSRYLVFISLGPALEFDPLWSSAQTTFALIPAAGTISWCWFIATSLTGNYSGPKKLPCPKLHPWGSLSPRTGWGSKCPASLSQFGRALQSYAGYRARKPESLPPIKKHMLGRPVRFWRKHFGTLL